MTILYFPGRGNAKLQSVQAKTPRYLREMINKDQKLERMQKYAGNIFFTCPNNYQIKYIDDKPNIYIEEIYILQ